MFLLCNQFFLNKMYTLSINFDFFLLQFKPHRETFPFCTYHLFQQLGIPACFPFSPLLNPMVYFQFLRIWYHAALKQCFWAKSPILGNHPHKKVSTISSLLVKHHLWPMGGKKEGASPSCVQAAACTALSDRPPSDWNGADLILLGSWQWMQIELGTRHHFLRVSQVLPQVMRNSDGYVVAMFLYQQDLHSGADLWRPASIY